MEINEPAEEEPGENPVEEEEELELISMKKLGNCTKRFFEYLIKNYYVQF